MAAPPSTQKDVVTARMPLTAFRNLAVSLDPAQRRLRAMLHALAQQVSPVDRMLDLGSGRAPYVGMFSHRTCVTADLQAGAMVRCDAGQLPFVDGSFGLVLCTEVLEHVPDPNRTLTEIRRTLTASGALVLTTPLTWGVHDELDYHRWTERGLRQVLARHGFEVIELKPRGGVLLCLGALLLIVPWQLFGPARERHWWQTVLFVLGYAVLLPVGVALGALDGLDRRQHFTHGYVALCRLSGPPAAV